MAWRVSSGGMESGAHMNRTITIAGGGLAGLSLGIALLRRKVPVRVIEAASYPRHRVCGEFISGITFDELESLGVASFFKSAARHHSTEWFDGGKPLFRENLPSEAFGISRYFLDEALARHFESLGGELQLNCRVEKDEEGVVWAAGRRKQASDWMGLKAHFTDLELSADLEIHLTDSGYVGMTRVENGRVNVCGLFRRSEAISRGLPHMTTRMRHARFVAGSLKGVSQFALGWQSPEDERVTIGDAAAMIPPFTGNGMTMAFQSALDAVEPLCAWSAGRFSWSDAREEIQTRHGEKFGKRLLWAQGLQRLLMHSFGRKASGWLLRSGCVSFESLYQKVR
jgi:menaquinone-9 beta-reductase